jgi:hypothetical protein
MVGGGAESIRGVSASGFEWIIDRNAARASELQPGRIMFLTGRAVGRVLRVGEQGGDLAVLLGPADLSEIICDCDIMVEQPLDLTQAVEYAVPDMPGVIVCADHQRPFGEAAESGLHRNVIGRDAGIIVAPASRRGHPVDRRATPSRKSSRVSALPPRSRGPRPSHARSVR